MTLNTADFRRSIFTSKLNNFDEMALLLFREQVVHNAVLKEYCARFNKPSDPSDISGITFLPAAFFKTHRVVTGHFKEAAVFTSSATTSSVQAKHYVKDPAIYTEACGAGFRLAYGDIKDYCVLALLPSYLERSGSSLVVMAADMIKRSGHPLSGFYLDNFENLFDTLIRLKTKKQKTILLGVTFALLDFAGQFPLDFTELIVMETGGMKGRRQELIREEVHDLIRQGFNVQDVHSEYGMTELLSQAYAKRNGLFECPPWMKIIITDPYDPMAMLEPGRSGVINIIDLTNMDSCAFIQTADVGRVHADGTFEVLGRLDNSDIRGCSLMYL